MPHRVSTKLKNNKKATNSMIAFSPEKLLLNLNKEKSIRPFIDVGEFLPPEAID